MTLSIRPYVHTDLPAVFALLTQLYDNVQSFEELDLSTMEQSFRRMEAQPHFYLNLVALQAGRPVGFMSLIFYATPTHPNGTALINELVVDREARRAGIGQALIQRARAEAQARDLDELEVGAETDNAPALDFYRKAGFDEEYVLLGMNFH
jgi:ribosomal protein S18 acetylase RimI-like enzyme